MRKLTGAAFISLDGVIQAPGGPDEDRSKGFPHGGWLAPFNNDALVNETVGALFTPPYALLLGRRTYDIFAGYWSHVVGPEAEFGKALTAAEKHVLTRSDATLEWDNSHRLADIDSVTALKTTEGPDLLIQGSSTLYPQLLAAGLIDRLILMIFPVVPGEGKRLFDGAGSARMLRALDQKISVNGVIAAHFEPATAIKTGTVGQT